jgi:Fe-S-cluster-containing hydrogenase component 2
VFIMAQRKIIQIDEEKCDGCGVCATACAEGAIAIRDGKARLVSEIYCDGLGACLGECPQGAITIIEREAEGFDEGATRRHLAGRAKKEELAAAPAKAAVGPATLAQRLHAVPGNGGLPVMPQAKPPAFHFSPGGCPGAAARSFQAKFAEAAEAAGGTPAPQDAGETPALQSALGHWPVQLRLVPPNAPFFQDADLLLVADCVPFAYADFHRRFLREHPLAIACPKLDDKQAAVDKLAAILSMSSVRSLTVVHMEVPCCTGLVRIAEAAIALSGRDLPLEDVTISVRGQVLERADRAHAGT